VQELALEQILPQELLVEMLEQILAAEVEDLLRCLLLVATVVLELLL
jgi:hypothetical protein